MTKALRKKVEQYVPPFNLFFLFADSKIRSRIRRLTNLAITGAEKNNMEQLSMLFLLGP